jgi:hypothetical protein
MQKPTCAASSLLALCLLASMPGVAAAQAAKPAKPAPGTPVAPAQALESVLSGIEKQFVPLAEAMPEDKFDFAPPAGSGDFKGVRTFAGQIKHVAEANYYYFSDPPMSPADFKAKRDAIEKLTSKADIVQALKDSFKLAHAYVASVTPENAWVALPSGFTRASLAAYGMQHTMDHYGQLVVYLRMNGIIPPASRPR